LIERSHITSSKRLCRLLACPTSSPMWVKDQIQTCWFLG
jgi:hypothetical protein